MENLIPHENVPLISVVMPVYNSAPFLAEAIESILNQTLEDFELLIVYDKSSDSSLAIIEGYQQGDNRIRVIFGEKNGLIGALNQGLKAAQGKFIARMDADDISLPERFEKQVQLLESRGGDICGCHFIVIGQTGTPLNAKIVPLSSNAITVYMGCTVPFAHGSVMMRKSFIINHDLNYNSIYSQAEDYNLWVAFFEKKAVFLNVDQFLFKYRHTETSLSNRLRKETAANTKFFRKLFHFRNREAFHRAAIELSESIDYLSQDEKKFLLMASYIAFRHFLSLTFFTVLKRSSFLSMGIFIYNLARGI